MNKFQVTSRKSVKTSSFIVFSLTEHVTYLNTSLPLLFEKNLLTQKLTLFNTDYYYTLFYTGGGGNYLSPIASM